ncbi:MAG TPA: di-heme oxidoredictase family protein [Burkholderiales bacterium]|nr:di-heme oxidoredictase family protein [Burkholderiales bacterium]
MKTTEITAIPASSRVVTHARRTVACAVACTLGGVLFAGAMVESMHPGALPAGPFSNFDTSRNAFNIPFVGLTGEQAESFVAGRAAFNEAWVLAPDPSGVWGLGPTFNEDRCVHCHENNGRGRASDHGEQAELGLLVRLSVPGTTDTGAPNPHPHYGDQLQNRGILDRVPAEGRAIVLYEEREVAFEDGETVMLRKPVIRFEGLEFGELGPDTMVSVRIAQQLVGLGLLESVPEETILAIAARQDPAIRGKPNHVWDHELEQTVLGRFGWKASQPTLRQQTAVAFRSDIGATTFMFPEENCSSVQTPA